MIILIGPTGSGKSFGEYELATRWPDIFRKCVSCTTRPPEVRHGVLETNGNEYYFLSEEEFAATELVEYDRYYIYHYGMQEKELLKDGRVPVVVCEPNGAKRIIQWCGTHYNSPVMLVLFDLPRSDIEANVSKRENGDLSILDKRAEFDSTLAQRAYDLGLVPTRIIRTVLPDLGAELAMYWNSAVYNKINLGGVGCLK